MSAPAVVPLGTGQVDWMTARRALAAEVARVTDMLRQVTHPDAPALGEWSLVEVAVHLSQAFLAVPALARGDITGFFDSVPPGAAESHSGSLVADIWDLAGATTDLVKVTDQRDPRVLADLISQRAAAYLAECETRSAHERHPWLVEGITAAQPTFTCHLLGEISVHGYDIARADGRRWELDRGAATLVVDGFIMPVLQALGTAMVVPGAAVGVTVTYELSLRHGGKWYLRFVNGELSIDQNPGGRVDCRLSAQGSAFLLLAYNRINQFKAIGRGQILASGRKPWMGLRLRSLIRNP
ncbi:MAG: SCP2 sterol-binding domain-containing protein [Acidimicrobiales bacterium]